MADQNSIRPNYGPMPKGKANIMRMGQTEVAAWGEDPAAMGTVPEERDYPNFGGQV